MANGTGKHDHEPEGEKKPAKKRRRTKKNTKKAPTGKPVAEQEPLRKQKE